MYETMKKEFPDYPCANCPFQEEKPEDCNGCFLWKKWFCKKWKEFRIALGKEVKENDE